MKDNVEVIHFHIKSRGVQGHVFVQITFENCTLNFYFQNGEIGIKAIVKLQPLLVWNVSACLRFLGSLVLNKNVFLRNQQRFLSRVLNVFSQNC